VIILKNVTAVDNLPAISVGYGTSFDALDLPAQTGVTYDDGSKGTSQISWTEGSYNGSQEGTYTLYGDLIVADGIGNMSNLKASILVTVLARPKHIVSVAASDTVTVDYGTSFSALQPKLPSTLTVTFDDNSQQSLPVVWRPAGYDRHAAGAYTLYGDLVLNSGIVNMDSVLAEIAVVVDRQFIVAVNAPSTIEVPFGTAFSDLILPETAGVTYNDGNTGNVTVEWQSGNYRSDLEGMYTLPGTLVPSGDIDNPDNLQAQINVRVLRRLLDMVSVHEPDTVHVPFGTFFADALSRLPGTVQVTLDNGQTAQVQVTWSEGDYQGNSSGPYVLSGTLTVPEGLSNSNVLDGKVTVVVDNRFLTAVDQLPPVTVSYGTAFGDLPLPVDVGVTYNDGSAERLPVSWNPAGYDAGTPGDYTLTGVLILPDDTDNPDDLKASVQVRVLVRKKNLVAVLADHITVDFGTAFGSIALPQTVTGVFEDLSQEPVNIFRWLPQDYDGSVAGVYPVKGLLNLSETVENPDSLSALLNVTVLPKYIRSLSPVTDLAVDFGTAFDQLPLPASVQVAYNDNSAGMADVIWQVGEYNEVAPGVYTLTGDLVPEMDAINKNNLQATIRVTVRNRIRVLTAVASGSLEVPYGTSFANLPLPPKLQGTFDDGSTEDLNIQWSQGDYEPSAAGVYAVSGRIGLPADAVNPNGIEAYAFISVGRKYIVSVAEPDTLRVPYQTIFEMLPLPYQVSVVFNDGSAGLLPVEWSRGGFNGETGVHRISGSLVLDEDTENPDDRQPFVMIEVGARIPNIESVATVPEIIVPFGTSLSEVMARLPEKVRVVYDTALEGELVTNWSAEAYDRLVAGPYIFKGTLRLAPGTTNLNELFAEVVVTVSEKAVISVTDPDPIQGIYGTAFASLNLPVNVRVSYNDNSSEELPVIWDEGAYNSSTLAEQQLSGLIQLPLGVVNTLNLEAKIKVLLLKNILSVEAVGTRSVTYGTPYAGLSLPGTVRVVYNDLSEAQLAVTWDSSLYAAAGAGQLAMDATLPVVPGTLNADDLKASVMIEISKAPLIITAEHKIRNQGEANPELTVTYEGFVKGESEAALVTKPVVSTSALGNSPVGSYPILIGGAVSANYEIEVVSGTLHVVAEPLAPLPASGRLSVFRIADYMLRLGEISAAERSGRLTIEFLNARSHLEGKEKPFKVRGWYGYSGPKTTATLVTLGIRSITTGTASTGGYVHYNGGADILEQGVCWSTSPEPTIDGSKVSGGNAGTFSCDLTGLQPATTYYVRAYARNSEGIAYGNEVSFTTGGN
ncbi:MAG TPA: Ig-like domain-containing protein, partial [Sphingobacteriaceae bacterium]